MSDHVLFNLFNEMGKGEKMWGVNIKCFTVNGTAMA